MTLKTCFNKFHYVLQNGYVSLWFYESSPHSSKLKVLNYLKNLDPIDPPPRFKAAQPFLWKLYIFEDNNFKCISFNFSYAQVRLHWIGSGRKVWIGLWSLSNLIFTNILNRFGFETEKYVQCHLLTLQANWSHTWTE